MQRSLPQQAGLQPVTPLSIGDLENTREWLAAITSVYGWHAIFLTLQLNDGGSFEQ